MRRFLAARRAVGPSLLAACLVLAALPSFAPLVRAQAASALSDTEYAALVASLSEPGGYFSSDNLITNEDSYLHAVGTLKRLGVTGGAYLGVGPDQNFSYIAAVRPRIAFILDIRRDNLLEHALFKAIFALARNRLEYLCLLFGKAAPADSAGWSTRDVTALLDHIDRAPADSATIARARARVRRMLAASAFPLSAADVETIQRFHRAFISEGLGLRWTGMSGRPRTAYSEYRRLVLETDLSGKRANFLASEADFLFLKSLHARNLVIPVVGNFGGDHALQAIARWLAERGERVSMFYTSNVEQYLFRDGLFEQFAKSVAQLPRAERSVFVRSYFGSGRYGAMHPLAVQGYLSVQLVQPMERFVAAQAAGGFQSYYDVVTRDNAEPR